MRSEGKNYETPQQAWEQDRIEEEKRLQGDYGLSNKKEVWKAQSMVRKFRRQARQLNAETDEQQEEELLTKLADLGIVGEDADLTNVLEIDVEDILSRRLQTIVHKRGLASTAKEARQLVNHGHIQIGERRVNIPSYLVREDEEGDIRVSPGSKDVIDN